jgi:hypothetical protein
MIAKRIQLRVKQRRGREKRGQRSQAFTAMYGIVRREPNLSQEGLPVGGAKHRLAVRSGEASDSLNNECRRRGCRELAGSQSAIADKPATWILNTSPFRIVQSRPETDRCDDAGICTASSSRSLLTCRPLPCESMQNTNVEALNLSDCIACDPDSAGLVSIGGTNATVLYAGSAPTLESGYFQINVALP